MPHYDVAPLNRHNARRMRHKLTDAELKLWNELRAHRLMGIGFRRQLPIDRYIVDFACAEYRLIVELDGTQHSDQTAYDEARTQQLQALGWTVLRFWNDEVIENIDGVCDAIIRTIGVGAFR